MRPVAERIQELTEPGWRQRIKDPVFRWYKEKRNTNSYSALKKIFDRSL